MIRSCIVIVLCLALLCSPGPAVHADVAEAELSAYALPEETQTPAVTAMPEEPEESAGFLFRGRERCVDAMNGSGPWLYESETLTVQITKTSWRGKSCYIADVRLRGNDRIYGGFAHQKPPGREAEMPEQIARRHQAVLGFTGDFLCHHANPKGVMIRERNVYYDKKDADMLAVFQDGNMDVLFAGSTDADKLLEEGAQDVFAFGPILLKDGKINPKVDNHNLHLGNYRTGIGLIERGHCLAVVTTDGFTLREFARFFQEQGCTDAYNLDGGHSASMVFMGKQLNQHGYLEELDVYQRPLPDLMMAGKSGLTPGLD